MEIKYTVQKIDDNTSVITAFMDTGYPSVEQYAVVKARILDRLILETLTDAQLKNMVDTICEIVKERMIKEEGANET